jgi:hypothetical protein
VRRPRPVTVAAVLGLCVLTTAGTGVATAIGGARPDSPVAAPGTPMSEQPAAQSVSAPLVHDGSVVPLGRLTAPDAIATTSHEVQPQQLQRLSRQPGVQAVTALDRGVVHLAGHRLVVVGVDPSAVRAFTPSISAASDPLWLSVAHGEVAVSYAAAKSLRHRLGETVHARGRGPAVPLRLGALAALGIGRAQAVVDRQTAALLHLRTARQVLVSAPRLPAATLESTLTRVLGTDAHIQPTRPGTTSAQVGDYARATIPAGYLSLYRTAAGTCAGLPWTVLAGIGAVETGHGAVVHRSVKGAVGPMQFLPETFAAYGIDASGDGAADVHDPTDAVYSAARYLCLWGAGRGGQALYDAVWAYNHADWYVRRVFAFANAYA